MFHTIATAPVTRNDFGSCIYAWVRANLDTKFDNVPEGLRKQLLRHGDLETGKIRNLKITLDMIVFNLGRTRVFYVP